MTAADGSLEIFFIVFLEKIRLDIHVKLQALFSLKGKSKKK